MRPVSQSDVLGPARAVMRSMPFRGVVVLPMSAPIEPRFVAAFVEWWRGDASQTDLAARLGVSQPHLSRIFTRIRSEAGRAS